MMPCTIYLMCEALEELAFSCNYKMKKAEYRQRQRARTRARLWEDSHIMGSYSLDSYSRLHLDCFLRPSPLQYHYRTKLTPHAQD